MSDTDANAPASPEAPTEVTFQTASDRLQVLQQRLNLEHHALRAAVISLSIWILKVISIDHPNDPVRPTRVIQGDAEASEKPDSATSAKPLGPTQATVAPPKSVKAPTPGAGGAGGIAKGTGNLSDQGAEDDYPLARLHRFFERNAGWGTILTAVILVGLIGGRAGSTDFLALQWIIAPVGLHLLFIILLFTRPFKTDADISTIFRFAWSFVAAATIFGMLFLILGLKGGSSSGGARPTLFGIVELGNTKGKNGPRSTNDTHPSALEPEAPGSSVEHNGSRPAATSPVQAHEDIPIWSANLLAIVRGCDYNSVVYKNARAARANRTTTSAKTGESATTVTSADAQPQASQPGMPEGVNCGDLPPQWVLVIGGSILECDFDGTCPKQQPRPNLGQLEADVAGAEERLKDAFEKKRRADNTADSQALFGAAGARPDGFARSSEADAKSASAVADDERQKLREAKTRLELEKKRGDYYLNIQGGPIVGGLVLPVFFVAIALMGALINMGRKLPEFQERVDPLYKKEFDEKLSTSGDVQTPISPPYARDLVVFQIVQVLSAPGIAILAYSWARPEDQAVTVIIAFAAGFTSEVFLLAVRGIVDRVIGLGPRPPRVRAVLAADARAPTALDIPPRGPAALQASTASGLKVGDLVTLLQPLGPCMPGAQGKVLSVGPGDEVIVQTFQDHTGAPLSIRLPSQSASFFKPIGAPTTPASGSGPAG